MASNQKYSVLASSCIYIYVLVVTLHMLGQGYVEGRTVQKYLGSKRKGTLKTIKSDDGGDVIDCVDIYQQPAFDHPLINDIKMAPPNGVKGGNSLPELVQNWHKNGECPEGTIPIRRTTNHNIAWKFPFRFRGEQSDYTSSQPPIAPHAPIDYEYAQVIEVGDSYYGVQARIEVWNPKIEREEIEFSASQIWIVSNIFDLPNLSTMETGWIVYPGLYGDNKTRLFTFWTTDNYNSTGCFDLLCSGFVQTSKRYALGGTLEPVSTYKGASNYIHSIVFMSSSGDWWFRMQDEVIGYWPASIFTQFGGGAEALTWGGWVLNSQLNGRHTSTQMGSGHFPAEGFRRSSYFDMIGFYDKDLTERDPTNLNPFASKPSCYDMQIIDNNTFFFGGPGYSPQCP